MSIYRVSRRDRCEICKRADWCTFTEKFAFCMRVSEGAIKQATNGSYIHLRDGGGDGDGLPVRPRRDPPKIPPAECYRIAYRFWTDPRADSMRESVAQKLGVTADILKLMGCGYGRDDHNQAGFASFPSKDGAGNIVGIVRRYPSGLKKTMQGMSTGLFYEKR